MQTIILRLLDTKRTVQSVENEVQVNAPNGYIIVAGENNTTNFRVEYSDKWNDFLFRVDMVNAKGQGFPEFGLRDNEFLLPAQMAVAGNTFITISAKHGDEVVVWERITIPVWSTNPRWIEEAPEVTWGGGVSAKIDITTKNITYTLVNNIDMTFSAADITNVNIIFSNIIKHGFIAGLNFSSGQAPPAVTFANNSAFPLEVIFSGLNVASYSPAPNKTVEAITYCNGINININIREI